jgi:hypothetical protein
MFLARQSTEFWRSSDLLVIGLQYLKPFPSALSQAELLKNDTQTRWAYNATGSRDFLLVWVTPSGFEKFIAEVGQATNGPVTPALTLNPADLEKILATASKYGIEMIPSPSEPSR